MVYYYGQLHIGHGFNETATHFVRNPLVKRLRHASLDAFWASAPLFMIAMALTFLSQVRSSLADRLSGLACGLAPEARVRLQYTGPDGHPSSGAVIVASIFGAGIGLMIGAVLMVLSAHRRELHYHYHPEERPAPTSSGSSVKERRQEEEEALTRSASNSWAPRSSPRR